MISVALAGLSACAAQPVEPPKPPPKQAHDDKPRPEHRVPHVAPPPAYGNKVVRSEIQTVAETLAPSENL